MEDATLLSSAPAALREVCRDFPKAERSFMSPYSFETFCQSAGRGAEEVGSSVEFRMNSLSARLRRTLAPVDGCGTRTGAHREERLLFG